jgi:predicted TIM-barrel fold metal-dependent hydrolase
MNRPRHIRSESDNRTTRRTFLIGAGIGTAAMTSAIQSAASQSDNRVTSEDPTKKHRFVIDTHMHVWADDLKTFPFAHPNAKDFTAPAIAATDKLLLEEMEQFGVTQCVLVQTIYHGWDNSYLARCIRSNPTKFRGHGLIDPTDPAVADKLDYWMSEHGLAGMRFSPIYYEGRDDWMTTQAAVELWKRAEKLKAVFNFFISTPQLPRLEEMIRQFPAVPVVIDHLARIDLKAADPQTEFQKLLNLARYPSVYVKVSELSVLSPSAEYPWKDTYPWVRQMYDAFGPDRMLWGTGFPGATRAQAGRPSLSEEMALIRTEIPFFNDADREKILGNNAARLWNFS